jgi:hypothetical protein
MRYRRLHIFAAIAALVLGASAVPAGASGVSVDYEFGNVQYANVNFNADVLTHPGPLTACVNNPDHTPFYFANPHDAVGTLIPYLHGSRGDAAFEA